MPRKIEGEVQKVTVTVRRWQVRLLSLEPWELRDSEILDRQDYSEVVDRAMTMVARASYMVGQPNREVLWSIELWNTQRQVWETTMQGRSKLRDRPASERHPIQLA